MLQRLLRVASTLLWILLFPLTSFEPAFPSLPLWLRFSVLDTAAMNWLRFGRSPEKFCGGRRRLEGQQQWVWCFWEASLHLSPGAYQIMVRSWDSSDRMQPKDVRHVWNFKGYSTRLTSEQSLEAFAEGRAHIGFLCGLLYVNTTKRSPCPIELLAAPVLYGQRYQGNPVYFSDILVRRASPYTSFKGLQGSIWAYNERASHSGWNLVCYSLRKRGISLNHFRSLVETGSHQRSLEMVVEGRADATAIDSHVLDVLFLQNAGLASELRVVDTLGPSPIPPLVVAKKLDRVLKHRIQSVLFGMHLDPCATDRLREGLIESFVPVTDEHYQNIWRMFSLVQAIERSAYVLK